MSPSFAAFAFGRLLTTNAQPTLSDLRSKEPRCVNLGLDAPTTSQSHSLGPGPELGRRAARFYNIDRAHWQALRTWL
jgi:hypothetical protein